MSYPSYYAIIPAHVRYCKKVPPGAKLLYGEITALTQSEGFCWATNQYFAELYEVEIRTIQHWLTILSEQNFIKIETEKKGIQWQRRIWISAEIKEMFTKGKKFHPPMKKISSPHEKNFTHNNTSNNTSKKNSFVPTPESLELANFFLQNLIEENPEFKKPLTLDKWAKDFESMVRIDKRNIEELKNIIKWATHDPFWNSNILSAAKLRKQYDQLKLKMQPLIHNKENINKKNQVLQELQKRCTKECNNGVLSIGYNYAEFTRGPYVYTKLYTHDGGFIEQLELNLRKINSDASWLKEFR